MKRILFGVFALAMALPLAAAAGHGEGHGQSAWFDMENCAFCKHMTKEPQLMKHLTWENHSIEDGALAITTVDAQYAKAYHEACSAMEALGNKLHSGEIDPATVPMCGHCRAFGELMMAGMTLEHVKGEAAEVSLMTADDPAVVAKIQAFAKRNNEELAKMEAAEVTAH